MPGNLCPERVAAFRRNGWQIWPGILSQGPRDSRDQIRARSYGFGEDQVGPDLAIHARELGLQPPVSATKAASGDFPCRDIQGFQELRIDEVTSLIVGYGRYHLAGHRR